MKLAEKERVIVCLLALLLSITYAKPCDLRSKSDLNQIDSDLIMHIVNGQRTAYQDGPNCFNAVLFGKGYVSELTFVDGPEFVFYINRFCSPSTQPEGPGDIITLKYPDDTYDHAALAIKGGLIFEKLSNQGRNLSVPHQRVEDVITLAHIRKSRESSSVYKIKTKDESEIFNDHAMNKAIGLQIQVYKCRDSRSIKDDLIRLSLIPGVQEILNINRKAEALVFSEKLEVNWQESLASDISIAAETAMKSSTSDDDSLFLLAKIKSLEGQLLHLTEMGFSPGNSNSSKFHVAFRKLQKAREVLETKQKQNKSGLAKIVLRALSQAPAR